MPKRLHWLLIPISIVSGLFNLIGTCVLIMIIAKQFKLPLWLIVGLFIVVILLNILGPIINYTITTYTLEPQEFTFKTGIINKQARHIPYNRIQSIERIQPWYMQLFHLVQLKIETASQDDKPVILTVLSLNAADEIENTRKHHQQVQPHVEVLYPNSVAPTSTSIATTPTTNEISYQINMHDFLIYGLTSLGILPGISVLLLVYSRLNEFIPKDLLDTANTTIVKSSIVIIILLAILAILFGMLVSLLQIINRYYHQVVTRNKNSFAISKGFLNKTTVHFDQRKIQGITIEQSFLRRLFKLYTVKLFISGSNKLEDANDQSLVLIPVIDHRSLPSVLHELLPEYDFDFNKLNRDNPKSHFWNFWRVGWLWFCWLPLGIIPWYFGWYVPVIMAVILIAVCITVWAWLDNAETKYAISADQLNIQTNVFMTKKIFLLRAHKLQSINHHQSIFMVKGTTHHLDFVIREGSHAASLTLRYLEANENEKLQKWYTDQVIAENK